MPNLDFLIPITMFLATAFIVFKFFDDRHRERMIIIEKGLASEDVKALYANKWKWHINPLSSLKWGLLAAFVGAGILIGGTMSVSFPWMHEDQLMAGFIFLFGGIGLMLFYALASKKMPANDL